MFLYHCRPKWTWIVHIDNDLAGHSMVNIFDRNQGFPF